MAAFQLSLEGWGLVGVPEAGGRAAYRSLPTLEPSEWRSSVDLPPASAVLGGPEGAALASPRGEISWYDLRDGRVDRLGRARRARLVARRDGSEGVVAIDTATREVAVLGRGEAWTMVADGRPLWADWVEENRLAVLSAGEGAAASLTLYKPPLKTVLRRTTVEATGRPVVTAWGSLLYVPGKDPNGRPALLALGAADLAQTGAIVLRSAASAVAATPSGHRLYAASSEGRIYVLDRPGGRLLRTIALPAPVDELRFNRTGEVLLARLAGTDSVAVVLAGLDRLAGVLPAEWGENLPWASPGGRYIVLRRNGALEVFESPDLRRTAQAPDADGFAWWPLAWTPPERPPAVVARGIEPARTRPESVPAPERTLPAARSEAVVTSRPTADEGAPGAGDTAATPRAPDAPGAPAGLYAVVSAARTPDGIRDLSAELAAEGFPASIDRYVDEMGTVWYRAIIGPYADRPAAEEAAGEVALRRGVRPWILEIRSPR